MVIPPQIVVPLVNALCLAPAAFVNGVGGQLVRRWFPAGMDKASMLQVGLKQEELALRRQEIAAAEERFLHQIAAVRDLKLEELTRLERMHINNITYQHELQQWPLVGLLPSTFVKASASRSGRALNVIFAAVDTHDPDYYDHAKNKLGGLVKEVFSLLHGKTGLALQAAKADFGGDMLLYLHVMKNARHSGDALRSTLWSQLHTEPTVLVEMNMVTADRLDFHVTHWGGAFQPDGAYVPLQAQSLIIPPSILNSSNTQWFRDLEAALVVGLPSLVVSLGDAYRTLHRPHGEFTPVLPVFLQRTAASLPPELLAALLPSYTATYDSVAAHSPMLAVELTAKAALAAREAQQPLFAEGLLQKALELFRTAVGKSMESETEIMAELARLRGEGRPFELERALEALHGLAPQTPKYPPQMTLGEMASHGINSIRSSTQGH